MRNGNEAEGKAREETELEKKTIREGVGSYRRQGQAEFKSVVMILGTEWMQILIVEIWVFE